MSRFGVGCAALLCGAVLGACRTPPPLEEKPYVANVDCDFEARGNTLSYGYFGQPSLIGYRCRAVEAPPPVEMPDGLQADPAAPATLVEPD